jgi:2-polyprenyl-3-methyl-5-hydroxy-6-metoxy-1,4-benzoquinol methylase
MYDSARINEYTNLEFWKKYWTQYSFQQTKDVFFRNLITDLPKQGRLLEIGGFPGGFAAYFYRNYGYDVAFLDYFIDPSIVNKVEIINEIPLGTIKYINEDLFKTKIHEEYDVVCSFGFLEHFEDTSSILIKHLQFLKNNGVLLVTIPNFRGINGWIQRIFHVENLKKHNLKCMNISKLKKIMSACNVKTFEVDYVGVPVVWLEKDAHAAKRSRLVLDYVNRILRRVPFQRNLLFAPYIYIKAVK